MHRRRLGVVVTGALDIIGRAVVVGRGVRVVIVVRNRGENGRATVGLTGRAGRVVRMAGIVRAGREVHVIRVGRINRAGRAGRVDRIDRGNRRVGAVRVAGLASHVVALRLGTGGIAGSIGPLGRRKLNRNLLLSPATILFRDQVNGWYLLVERHAVMSSC